MAQAGMNGKWLAPTDGEPTPLACPDCGGAVRRFDPTDEPQYRCQVGHSFGTDLLLDRQSEELERAMWIALRVMNERQHVLQRLADDSRRQGRVALSATMDERAAELAEQSAVLRHALSKLGKEPSEENSAPSQV